jgi:hypothetical protein
MSPLLRPMAVTMLALITVVGCGESPAKPEDLFKDPVYPLDTARAQLVLVPIQGNNQTGVIRGLLTDSLIVRVMTQSSYPVPGVNVNWASINAGADITYSTVTDHNGYARAGWSLGSQPGDQTAWAIVTGLSHASYFRATATDSTKR